jgi:Flp pilus assembly pilin Flp
MKKVIKRLYKDESGASSTEYAILVCCIAVAIIFTVLMFGQVVNGLYTNANAKFL